MYEVLEFDSQLQALLPETYSLLKSSKLTVHESVSRIILHGSRGLADSARPDSDIDLSLIVDTKAISTQADINAILDEISKTTLSNWDNDVELDLAIVFDIKNCGLKCFDLTGWDEQLCPQSGVDCFGLYKTQKGFNGLVTGAGLQVKLMYPCLRIWHRE